MCWGGGAIRGARQKVVGRESAQGVGRVGSPADRRKIRVDARSRGKGKENQTVKHGVFSRGRGKTKESVSRIGFVGIRAAMVPRTGESKTTLCFVRGEARVTAGTEGLSYERRGGKTCKEHLPAGGESDKGPL